MKKGKLYFQIDEFLAFEELVHAFSMSGLGNMKEAAGISENLKKFVSIINVPYENLVRCEQTHSEIIKIVDERDKGRVIEGADGIISPVKGIFLCVFTADCMPVILYDSSSKVAGLIHVGWKGLMREIHLSLKNQLELLGCSPENVKIGIGPSIRVCCYSIEKTRAAKIIAKFPLIGKQAIIRKENKFFLDIQKFFKLQLLSSGFAERNIIDSSLCTFHSRGFMSYRRSGSKEDFARSAAIIGIR